MARRTPTARSQDRSAKWGEVSPEQAYRAARLTALSILGSLKRALGDLDQVTVRLRVFGM